jgi:hypothetical protein
VRYDDYRGSLGVKGLNQITQIKFKLNLHHAIMAMIFKTHAVVESYAQTLVTGARNHEKGRYDSCRKL